MLDQVAAAGLVGRRPRAASAEDRKSHVRAGYMVERGITVDYAGAAADLDAAVQRFPAVRPGYSRPMQAGMSGGVSWSL